MDAKAKAAATTLARAFAALGLAAAAAALEKHASDVTALTTKVAVSGAQTFADAINEAIGAQDLGFPANEFKGRITGIVTGSFENLATAAATNAPAGIASVVKWARTAADQLAS